MSELGLSSHALRRLHRLAARVARTSAEVDDLYQDALLAALEQKRDLTDSAFPHWASAVIRRRALFLARTAGRRRRREATYALDCSLPPSSTFRLPIAFITALPPSLQTVALLANADLARTEIAYLLGLSDTALRKRLSELRRAWRESEGEPELAPSCPPHEAPSGLARRSLRATLQKLPAARLAVADPDGHEIFLGSAHKLPTHGN